MIENHPTWFGLNLNQKQIVYILFFAIIGLLIGVYVFVMYFSSMFMSFYYMINDPYYQDYYQDTYFVSMLFSSIPTLSFFVVLISICSYSISRCRKTAEYFRQINLVPQKKYYPPQEPQIRRTEIDPNYDNPMYCANCGAPRKKSHQFCVNCGYKFN